MEIKILLIDADSIGYACNAVGEKKLNSAGMEVQGVLKMLQSIRARLKDFPGYVPILIWDGHSFFRRAILSDYKSGRVGTPEKLELKKSYKAQVPYIQKIIHCSGLIQVNHPNAEADDLAYQITRKTNMAGIKTVILTSDSDLLQCVNENTIFVHARANKDGERQVVDMENFVEETGFSSPHIYIQGKAISADDTDDIAGVHGIGLPTASKISKGHGSIQGFFEDVDQGLHKPKGVVQNRLNEEGRAVFERNMQLMDLSRAPQFLPDARFSKRAQPSFQAAMETLGELNLLKEIKPAFFEVFEAVAKQTDSVAEDILTLLKGMADQAESRPALSSPVHRSSPTC